MVKPLVLGIEAIFKILPFAVAHKISVDTRQFIKRRLAKKQGTYD
jgi:hypothetical protein